MPLRRHQTAKPLGRRVVAEHTQGVTRNSEAAQVLGRIMMLPIAVLREILNYLDTKLLDHDASVFDIAVGFRHWTGTYGLPVIGSCNYRAVITAVITGNYSPPFSVTCNL